MPQRVLVVEDDPVSAEFFCASLAELGEVERLADGDALQRRLSEPAPDLLLLDDRIGDLRADRMLAAVREAWGERLPILLVSADLPPALEAERRQQGADACLAKPMSRDLLWQALGSIAPALLPAWDEAAAERSLGAAPEALRALRGLLLAELPVSLQRLREALAGDDHRALAAELHRLRAACGFCGASALGAAAARLSREPGPAAFQSFEDACAVLRSAASSP